MADEYDIEVFECPGCKRRFKRADIKTDRIKCPSCGREVLAKVTIVQQDERRLVEQFLNENGIGATFVSMPWVSPLVAMWIVILFYVFIIVAILCTGFSFWRLVWVAIFLFMIKFLIGRYYGKGRKVRSFFERNGYDLEAGLAEYNEFISGLGELERETYCYEGGDFEKKMRTYVRAHVDIKNKFDAKTTSECDDHGDSHCQYESVQKTYDMPPDVCPSCGSPYRVGDFNVHTVTCRKCGTSIGVANVVSDEELHDLLVWFVSERGKRNPMKYHYFHLLLCTIMSIWNVLESGLLDFLYSWSVLWLYAALGMVWYIGHLKKEGHKYDYFLQQKRINLFELEFYVKSENGETGSDTDVFYEFKERLMDLYRKSGSMVKGGELS